MKLFKEELNGLRQMIAKTSSKVLEKFQVELSKTNYDYLFLGDSMIEYLNLESYFGDINAINRGVAGATTKFINDNIDTIISNINPKTIFLSVGSNDLVLLEATPDETASNVINLIDKLRGLFPNAKINYLSTTPVINEDHKLYKKIYIAGRTNDELKRVNELVFNNKNNSYNFINLFDSVLKDNYLNEDLTYDGIHLNKNGYEIYTEILKKHM